MFYRHELTAGHEKNRRDIEKVKLEEALNEFTLKLNVRKFQEFKHCQIKLDERLKAYPNTKKFVQCTLSVSDSGVISLRWLWDEISLSAEEKYDGIFALLTNYKKEQVNANQLVQKYRGRDQVEVDFKDIKGILDLGRIIYQRPERIDAYIF